MRGISGDVTGGDNQRRRQQAKVSGKLGGKEEEGKTWSLWRHPILTTSTETDRHLIPVTNHNTRVIWLLLLNCAKTYEKQKKKNKRSRRSRQLTGCLLLLLEVILVLVAFFWHRQLSERITESERIKNKSECFLFRFGSGAAAAVSALSICRRLVLSFGRTPSEGMEALAAMEALASLVSRVWLAHLMPFHPTSQGSWSLTALLVVHYHQQHSEHIQAQFSASTALAPAPAIIHLEQEERKRRLLFAEGCKPSPKLHTHTFTHSFIWLQQHRRRKESKRKRENAAAAAQTWSQFAAALGAHRHTVKLLLSVTQFGRVL